MDKQYFINKLSINRPSVFEKYNYDLLPETFKVTDKVNIDCYQHGIFIQSAANHLAGQGCPVCGNQRPNNGFKITTEVFIKNSKNIFKDKFDYTKTNYTKKLNELIITCPNHGDFTIRANAHMWSTHGCPKCDIEIPREISKQKSIEKAKLIHNNKYNYSKVNFTNFSTKVEIICPNHGSFWQNFSSHVLSRTDCPKCALDNNKFSLEEFILKSKAIHGDNYDYSKVKYETITSMVTITCKKHGDFIQRAGSHLDGCKCKKCFIEGNTKSTEDFIKEARTIHGDNYDYSKVKYHNSKRPVEIICAKHGSFWQKPNSHISTKNGCRFCSESKGERSVEIFLKKYNIKYIREYRFLPYLYRYDFYLPDFGIYIEYNGIQHYKSVEIFGGELGFLKTKENDEIKKRIVKENNQHLIIITYLCLNENSVEKELVRQLRNIYKFWFINDGKIQVFKLEKDLYKPFGISSQILLKDIVFEVKKINKNLNDLF